MLQNDTHPEMIRAIIHGLTQWRTGANLSRQSYTDWFDEAIAQQSTLGWRNFFEGMIATKWQEAQKEYLLWIRSRKLSKWWATAMVRKLWQTAWDMGA
jgi:hypothetical protein